MAKRKKSAKGVTRLVKALVAPPKRPKVRVKRPTVAQVMARQGVLLNTDQQLVYQRYLQEKQKQLAYRKFQEAKLSPYTQRQLAIIAAIQNKAKTDDAKRQRIKREQAILGKSMNILSTPYVFKDNTLDVTNVDNTQNILMAPNAFKERPDNPHILKSDRPNILQTREAGNDLLF
jgi:capsular polysaccharide biosynthesis protein